MSKVIRLIKNISSFILVFVTTFLVGYTLFISCKDIIPLPVYIEVRRIYTTVLTIIIIVSFPVLAVSSFSRIFRILFSLLLIPFCCFFSFISINMPEKILNTTKLERYYYHILIKVAQILEFCNRDMVYLYALE